jgi:hypothetical protein
VRKNIKKNNYKVNALNQLHLFNKIILMIGYNYNDFVILELMHSTKSEDKFIHSVSEHGQNLLKMVINNMYDNELSRNKRSKTVYHEALNLFSVGDNNYYLNFAKIDSFQNFNLFNNILSNISNQHQAIQLFYEDTKQLKEIRNKEIKNYFVLKFEIFPKLIVEYFKQFQESCCEKLIPFKVNKID